LARRLTVDGTETVWVEREFVGHDFREDDLSRLRTERVVFTECDVSGVRPGRIRTHRLRLPKLHVPGLVCCDGARAPEWVRDLCWQVAAGFITGDDAVAVILDGYPCHPICSAVEDENVFDIEE